MPPRQLGGWQSFRSGPPGQFRMERRRSSAEVIGKSSHHPPSRGRRGSYELTNANDQAIRRSGVEFIDQNGGGPGVRLRIALPTADDEIGTM